ncbi:MAG TPA: hypothetical protein VKP69_07295 [Isosphaeraceae bacterium]|nr:hypothetical protein [Isosphaeraceae bacterium]
MSPDEDAHAAHHNSEARQDVRKTVTVEVVAPQGFGVLLPRREQGLVTPDVLLDGIFGELDPVVVEEFGLDQGDGHVA